jgi:ABC-type Na+ transport system ATPase subunit NatA
MIVGVFLRYYKTYQGINYAPLTDEDQFCGLVGENGIGKSSILEALDTFFNSRPWNFNTVTKRSGMSSTKPEIVPVFLMERSYFAGEVLEKAEALSQVALELSEDSVSPSLRPHVKRFVEHRNRILASDIGDKLLLPIGINHNGLSSVSLFNGRLLVDKVLGGNADEDRASLDLDELSCFDSLLNRIKENIEYIYIPREIDPESFTKLEKKEIQVLMGETLNQILSERVPQSQIADINNSLNEFIGNLTDELEIYSYRTPTDRQQNLRRNDLYNLIIQAFFNIRKLHKKQGDNWLEINSLSSGEKQKAVIDVAHSLLNKHRESGANLVIGVDEPESSLHMSACFDQFDALYDISRDCMQVIFSSHWYGFLPTIESGSATIISRKDGSHVFDQINLGRYREQVKQLTADTRGRLPYDIRLKSVNDFVQSVITSAIGDQPFNWIICEGSSEKIYLSAYLHDFLKEKRLRIVPVGGAKEIKRLYRHLSISYLDFKDEISGKIILISDTDPQLVRYEVERQPNLICKRMVNCPEEKTTKLVDIHSNPVSPATEIEDSLNGKVFLEALQEFCGDYPEELGFLEGYKDDAEECASRYSLDLRGSEWGKIEDFFNKDNNKYNFSLIYAKKIGDEYLVPSWIDEIRGWLE